MRATPLTFALLLCAACGRGREETYGFVATLGSDTTSVERITRSGNRVTGDAVGRSPLVVRRHWEATFADDGTLRSWKLDTRIPNGADVKTLHHEATFDGGVASVVRQVNDSVARFSYRSAYRASVPWNAFLYGSYEPLLAAARKLSDTTRVGIYFFEGWAEGQMGYAQVRALGGDSVSLSSTGLSGSGVAHFDAAGRMLSYSGEGTTYKQQVRRVDNVPDLDAIEQRFAAAERTAGVNRRLSLPDTARGTVGDAQIEITYGRPLARGRVLVGGLIPYGRVWRTGANEATHLRTSAPIRVGGVRLAPGTYTLWTLPTEGAVQLILNRQTGQWGTGYQAAHDIARVPMRIDNSPTHVEAFTIRIDDGADGTGTLVMAWGTTTWSVEVRAEG